jgi:cell division protein FtsZ
MGTGFGEGEDKAQNAAQEAISSPLLENVSIGGARGVLINVTGGEDMTLFDVNTATSLIYEESGADANIIFGAVIDPNMENQMRVTVIATGFGGGAKAEDAEEEKPAEEPFEPTRPGKMISLFPEEVARVAPAARRMDPVEAVTAAEPEIPAAANMVPEEDLPEPAATAPKTGYSRMPSFTDDDRTIPAYIRRLEEN